MGTAAGWVDVTWVDDVLELSFFTNFSVVVLASFNLLANLSEHPYISIPSKRYVRRHLVSSIYVTACINGHNITLVWSLKKLI